MKEAADVILQETNRQLKTANSSLPLVDTSLTEKKNPTLAASPH